MKKNILFASKGPYHVVASDDRFDNHVMGPVGSFVYMPPVLTGLWATAEELNRAWAAGKASDKRTEMSEQCWNRMNDPIDILASFRNCLRMTSFEKDAHPDKVAIELVRCFSAFVPQRQRYNGTYDADGYAVGPTTKKDLLTPKQAQTMADLLLKKMKLGPEDHQKVIAHIQYVFELTAQPETAL